MSRPADPSPLTPAELATLRREFPVCERFAYLNHAAIGPLPGVAARAMGELAATVAATGDRHWPERNEACEESRRLVAGLLGASQAHEVAFVANTSTALSLVAQGLDWRPGDNVIGAWCEFPSNVHPWMELSRRSVEYRQVRERDGRLDLDEVRGLADERTRVVALSWVQYASGFRSDLASLGRWCRERGILFVIDVIQGLGCLPLDVEACCVDAAAGAAHKWLLGPEGVGVLFVSDRVVQRIRPLVQGWRSVRDKYQWTTFDRTLAPGATRFESGTLNAYGIVALAASVRLLTAIGIERIERRVLALADLAAAELRRAGWQVVGRRWPGETAGIVAASHPERDAEGVAAGLAAEGVVVAQRAGRLRVSPHVYNSEDEIRRLGAALSA